MPESGGNWRANPARPRVQPDGGLAIESRGGLGGVRRFSHEAMATVFEVFVVHDDGQYAAQAAHAAFDLVDRLERELSRFIPNSDIQRISHLAAGERTRVTPTTLECLVIARHMYELTGGAFDVSIGTGLASLALDPETFEVRATTNGVRVDLGGVGKGYAVDLVAELLEEWGIGRALVHGGFSSGTGPRAAARERRLAADAQRPGRTLAGARAAVGAPDRARRLRHPQDGPHRRSAHRRARPRAAGGVGDRAAPARGA